MKNYISLSIYLFITISFITSYTALAADKCSSFGNCKGLSLVSRLNVQQLGWPAKTMCTSLWGWKDPRNNRRYIVLTCEPGQSVIDVTDENNPRAVAKMKGHAGGQFRWRDVKIYKDHAYFVSDALLSRVQILDLKNVVGNGSGRRMLRKETDDNGNNMDNDDEVAIIDQGEMEFVDLRNLVAEVNVTNDNVVTNEDGGEEEDNDEEESQESDDNGDDVLAQENRKYASSDPKLVDETAIYQGGGLYQSHNIEINEQSGFAYAVGGGNNCKNGLHMINLSNPKSPKFAGCFYDVQNQYIHDAHCRSYTNNDLNGKYAGKEICFGFAVFNLLIIDVTNKNDVKLLSKLTWPNAAYIHQGWLTEDKGFLVVDDERDDTGDGIKTFIVDVRDLSNPRLAHVHVALGETFGDHNQYLLKIGDHDYTFQANYAGGIRVLRINRGPVRGQSNDEILSMEEVAFFDTNKKNNDEMDGVWSVYPYFDDLVITSDMDNGLFILRRTFNDNTPAIPYKTNGRATPSPTVWADCPSFKGQDTCERHVACVWDIDWVQTKGWFWGCYNSKTVKPTKPYRAPAGGAQGCNRFQKAQCNMYPACIYKGKCSPFGG